MSKYFLLPLFFLLTSISFATPTTELVHSFQENKTLIVVREGTLPEIRIPMILYYEGYITYDKWQTGRPSKWPKHPTDTRECHWTINPEFVIKTDYLDGLIRAEDRANFALDKEYFKDFVKSTMDDILFQIRQDFTNPLRFIGLQRINCGEATGQFNRNMQDARQTIRNAVLRLPADKQLALEQRFLKSLLLRIPGAKEVRIR